MNIPSSQMSRLWTPRSRAFYRLHHLRRVRGMTAAAQRQRIDHLWLQPHDFKFGLKVRDGASTKWYLA